MDLSRHVAEVPTLKDELKEAGDKLVSQVPGLEETMVTVRANLACI